MWQPSHEAALPSNTTNASSVSSTTETSPPCHGSSTKTYWTWFEDTFAQLTAKFHGDLALAMEQMQYIECLTHDHVNGGLSAFSDAFVRNFELASNQTACLKRKARVATGQVALAVPKPTAFDAASVAYADNRTIQKIVAQKQASVVTPAPATTAPNACV